MAWGFWWRINGGLGVYMDSCEYVSVGQLLWAEVVFPICHAGLKIMMIWFSRRLARRMHYWRIGMWDSNLLTF